MAERRMTMLISGFFRIRPSPKLNKIFILFNFVRTSKSTSLLIIDLIHRRLVWASWRVPLLRRSCQVRCQQQRRQFVKSDLSKIKQRVP